MSYTRGRCVCSAYPVEKQKRTQIKKGSRWEKSFEVDVKIQEGESKSKTKAEQTRQQIVRGLRRIRGSILVRGVVFTRGNIIV